jgi:nucleoside-diphosphate-sugar epimerase
MPTDLPKGVDFHELDLTNDVIPKNVFKGVRHVIHAAGLAHQFGRQGDLDENFQKVNNAATRHLIEVAAQENILRFIYLSSVSVYGPHSIAVCDETHACNPTTPYALSKFHAELAAIEVSQRFGIDLTILRLATVYGEGDPGNVARLIKAIRANRFIRLGSGANFKSLIHRDDVGRACELVLQTPNKAGAAPAIYNLASKNYTVQEILRVIHAAVNKTFLPIYVPSTPVSVLLKLTARMSLPKASDLLISLNKWLAQDGYSNECFVETFNFSPRVSLTEGIKREVEWIETLKPSPKK